MPAGNLSSDWVCIATSGATADGREIKKEWLTSMAESYDPEFYSAKIWLDHYRWFGSQGEVLELKTEKAANEKLKGELQLFARMSPTAELVDLNRNGQYHHVSIEPIEDFGGKGFTYLGGIGITDYPASLGTSNVHFNGGEKTSKNYMGCEKVDLSKSIEADVETKFYSRFLKFLKSETNQQDDEMKPEQFNELLAAQNKTNEAIASLVELFSKKPPITAPKEGEQETPTNNGVSAEEFAALQAENKTLSEKFTALETQFNQLKVAPVPGTVPATADGGVQEECL